jgi:hypothetical protein
LRAQASSDEIITLGLIGAAGKEGPLDAEDAVEIIVEIAVRQAEIATPLHGRNIGAVFPALL